MALRIHKANIDRLTAHVEVEACVQEVVNGQLTEGPMETFGIDRDALLSFHDPHTVSSPTDASMHAALCKWLNEMHTVAHSRKCAHDRSNAAVAKLAGTVLEFGGDH